MIERQNCKWQAGTMLPKRWDFALNLQPQARVLRSFCATFALCGRKALHLPGCRQLSLQLGDASLQRSDCRICCSGIGAVARRSGRQLSLELSHTRGGGFCVRCCICGAHHLSGAKQTRLGVSSV